MHSAPAALHGFRAVEALRRLVRALHDSARMAQGQTGVSGAQLFVLRVLAAHPGLSINELAAQTMTHQSSVSVVVSRLLARGLVARAPSPDDRRRQLVTLTRHGRALHQGAPPVAQERIVAAVRALTPARQRALADGLRALTDALGATRQGASMFFEEDEPGAAKRAPRPAATTRKKRKAHV